MTTTPAPITVNINGVNTTGTTLANVRVTGGRDSLTSQPSASYATFSLIGATLSAPEYLNKTVTITYSAQTIFSGLITDSKIGTLKLRPTWQPVHTLTAVGKLRNLTQITVPPLDTSTDSYRVAKIITQALSTQWGAAQGTWLTQTNTWDYVEYFSIDTGAYTLASVTSSSNGYDLATSTATDAGGIITDTPTGQIAYQSEGYRNVTRFSTDAITIDCAQYVDLDSAGVETQLGDVINTVNLTYATGTVTAQDTTSANAYGYQTNDVKTILTDPVQAQNRADRLVTQYAQPRANMRTLTIPMNIASDALSSQLAGVKVSTPLILTNVPTLLGGQSSLWRGYVEGYAWDIQKNDTYLTLNISEYSLSTTSDRWRDKLVSQTWATTATSYYWYNS